MVVSGIVLALSNIFTLVNARIEQIFRNELSNDRFSAQTYRVPNYPPVLPTERQQYPETVSLNIQNLQFDRRHLEDFSYLSAVSNNNLEASDSDVRDFLNTRGQLLFCFHGLGAVQKRYFKQIIAKFIEREQNLTDETRDSYNHDVRTFIREMERSFANCSNRVNSDLEDFYNDYVECDPNYLQTLEFGNLIRNWLHTYRKNLFKEALVPHSDEHAAATNNFYRRTLGARYGIYNPLTSRDYNYSGFAIRRTSSGIRLEDVIHQKFIENYTPAAIVAKLIPIVKINP